MPNTDRRAQIYRLRPKKKRPCWHSPRSPSLTFTAQSEMSFSFAYTYTLYIHSPQKLQSAFYGVNLFLHYCDAPLYIFISHHANSSTLSAPLSCRIQSSSCDFPFRHGGFKKTSCISSSDIDALSEDSDDDYFCKQNRGSRNDDGWDRVPGGLSWSWGVCTDGCFETGSDCEFG